MASRRGGEARAAIGVVFLLVVLVLAGATPAGAAAAAAATAAPVTKAPVTKAPATKAPVTKSTPVQGVTFTFPQLGLSSVYSFSGNGSSIGVEVPVPQALRPSTLVGSLVIPPGFGTGALVLQSSGQFVTAFALPASSTAYQTIPFSLALSGLPVSGDYADLTLVLQELGVSGAALRSQSCGSTLPLNLTGLHIDYSGNYLAPTSISTFFPPVLNRLTVYVPATPTMAEQEAALRISLAATSIYKLMPFSVQVDTWNGQDLPESLLPLQRAIVISGSGAPALALGGTVGYHVLVVSGGPSTLVRQAALLADDIRGVLQTSSGVALSQGAVVTQLPTDLTFSQLGLNGAVTFSGQQQIGLPLDEARFGGVVTAMNVDVRASYTPLGSGEKGSVEASVNGVVLGTQSLNGSGQTNLSVSVPGQLITRSTDLVLTVTYFPAGYSCGSNGRTMTYTVDPRSTVDASVSTKGSGGFPDLPESLQPTMQVAFDQPGMAELTTAVSTLCNLQRITSVALQPQVVSLRTAEHSDQPVLVVSQAADVDARFNPPLDYRGHKAFRVAGGQGTSFSEQAAIASIQVFAEPSHHRTVVLATTSGSWGMLQSLTAHLGNSATRWSALTGDVVAISAQGRVVDLAIRAGGPQLFVATPTNQKLYLLVAGAFVLLLVLLGVWALLRRHHRQTGETRP